MTEAADQVSTVVTKHTRLLLVRSHLAAGQKSKHQGPTGSAGQVWEREEERAGSSPLTALLRVDRVPKKDPNPFQARVHHLPL